MDLLYQICTLEHPMSMALSTPSRYYHHWCFYNLTTGSSLQQENDCSLKAFRSFQMPADIDAPKMAKSAAA